MAVHDLFSKREARKSKAGTEDVFQYEDHPTKFRVQVIHIWDGTLGIYDTGMGHFQTYYPNIWWQGIFGILTRERGEFSLTNRRGGPDEQCRIFMLDAPTKDALDLLELAFRYIDGPVRNLPNHVRSECRLRQSSDEAIEELNVRFRENGIGYEFVGGEIVRVDSKYLHAEAVRPAVQLLHDAGDAFKGPLQEFMSAHARYRKGETKEAILDAAKSFESVLKSICSLRGWPYRPEKDTAKDLIQIVFDQGLVPSFLQSEFGALRSILESAAPVPRNKRAAHGQGPIPVEVPEHLASFVLHMAASNIVFLIESHRAMG